MLRQVLKCNNLKLTPKVISLGYSKINGKKYTANAVYVPSADEQYKTREQWSQAEIDAIANRISDNIDESIIAQSKFKM